MLAAEYKFTQFWEGYIESRYNFLSKPERIAQWLIAMERITLSLALTIIFNGEVSMFANE